MGIGASAAPGLDRHRLRELAGRERAALDDRTRGSEAMLRRAERVLPGGVASSYHLRTPWPIYLERGEGLLVNPGREPEWTMSVAHSEQDADRYVEVLAALAGALTVSRRPSGSARAWQPR